MEVANYWWSGGAAANSGGSDPGDPISQSLRWRNNQTLRINNNAADHSSSDWTFSVWAKSQRQQLKDITQPMMNWTQADGKRSQNIGFQQQGSFGVYQWFGGPPQSTYTTKTLWRDNSHWYHFMVTRTVADAATNNGFRVYVNGKLQTEFNTTGGGAASGGLINNTGAHRQLGWFVDSNGAVNTGHGEFLGMMAEHTFVDGVAFDPTVFGRENKNRIWVPVDPTKPGRELSSWTSYGSNSWRLTFDPNQAQGVGTDSSGKGNHFQAVNFDLTPGSLLYDVSFDTPTNNICMGNAMACAPEANITASARVYLDYYGGGGGIQTARAFDAKRYAGTHPLPKEGKWWLEVYINNPSQYDNLGISNYDMPGRDLGAGMPADWLYVSWEKDQSGGNGMARGQSWRWSWPGYQTFANGDVLNLGWDASTLTLTAYKNGTKLGNVFSNIDSNVPVSYLQNSDQFYFCVGRNTGGTTNGWAQWNYGQQPWTHAPQDGHIPQATSQAYLEPTITDGDDYHRLVTVTSSGGSDAIWTEVDNTFPYGLRIVKMLDGNNGWQFDDSLSGPTATQIQSSTNQPWNPGNRVNVGGTAWAMCFATPASHINLNSGFSISTGAHGLGGTPDFVIAKWGNMYMWQKTLGLTTSHLLAQPGGVGNSGTWTVNSTTVNFSAAPAGTVYYTWKEVPGYSKFGTYRGNGNADGPYVFTGFKPKFLMRHRSSSNWTVVCRPESNPSLDWLCFNQTSGVQAGDYVDLIASGFKVRHNSAQGNASNEQMIYMAFADNPWYGDAMAR